MVLSLKRQLSRNDILFEFNNIRSLGGQLMISSEQLALANSKILNVIALTVTNPRHLKVSLTCKLVIKYAFKFICGYRRSTGSKIQSFNWWNNRMCGLFDYPGVVRPMPISGHQPKKTFPQYTHVHQQTKLWSNIWLVFWMKIRLIKSLACTPKCGIQSNWNHENLILDVNALLKHASFALLISRGPIIRQKYQLTV